ncbi:MAG TPA: MFS transporter [Alphaproteobacteria bacterium]|nr:MFS transporter [Alphaproteobacteria bacterium]
MPRLPLLLLVGIATQTMTPLVAFTAPVMAVVAAPEFGVTPAQVGLYVAVLYFFAMLSAGVAGALIARFGAIRTTQLALASTALGVLLLLPASVPLALLGALLIGAGYGPITPASSHLLAPVTTLRSRPFVFSVKQTAVPLGAALAGVIVPQMIGLDGWRAAVLLVAAIVVVTAVAVQPVRARCDTDRNIEARISLDIVAAVRSALAHPPLRRLAILSFTFAGLQMSFGAYFVTFLVERLELTLVAAGIAFTVGQATSIGFRIIWGAAAERIMAARALLIVLALTMAAASALTLAMSPAWSLPAIAGLGALFGVSAVAWNGLFLAEIVRVTSVERTAAATGGALVFTFGGMMAGPAVFGALLAAGASYGAAFTVLGGVALLSALPLAWADRPAP